MCLHALVHVSVCVCACVCTCVCADDDPLHIGGKYPVIEPHSPVPIFLFLNYDKKREGLYYVLANPPKKRNNRTQHTVREKKISYFPSHFLLGAQRSFCPQTTRETRNVKLAGLSFQKERLEPVPHPEGWELEVINSLVI